MPCEYCSHCRTTLRFSLVVGTGVALCATILAEVAEAYHLTTAKLLDGKRTQPIALSRHVAMYLARELTSLTFPEIAEVMHRDHSSVQHGCKKIKKMLKERPIFAYELSALRARIMLVGSDSKPSGPVDGAPAPLATLSR